jgi:cell division protease FtsH
MSEENPKSPNGNRQRPNGGNDPQMNWRGLVLLSIALALIGGAFLFRGNSFTQAELIQYPQFLELVKQGKLVVTPDQPLELVVEEGRNTQYLEGKVKQKSKTTGQETTVPFRTPVFTQFNGSEIEQTLKAANITPAIVPKSDYVASAILSFLPIILFLVILYFFFRSQIKMAGKGALNFGKSKARMMSKEKNRITFKDVAGVEEAKDEVQELVEFLKDPKRFQKLGGRIPKGVLMVGSPGTGKTLLARAIAGEADVPFFSISGSDFVEMFVGVGASRVRDMFEQGKKSAPCLMFIDEIDAVGRHRGHGLGGGHDEREQTLNQLLVEMDGFDTQDGVIIIAATNRPDVLDPALLRPGRFDRQVTVSLPDVKGREEILKVHAKKVKLADSVNLAVLARGTPGYSGAELANVINEAALLAARKGLRAITGAELEEARDKVRWGRERRSMAMSEKEKSSTAWHEAGHALVSILTEHTDPLHKVTIIPRGRALGVTMSLPVGDQYSFQRREALDIMAMTAAGRIAEELFTNDLSTGASNDIKQMTRLARKMVCEWGMSDKLGMVEYGEHEDYVFLGRDINKARDYSEATAQEIDREVRRLVDEAYARAKDLILTHRDKVELIAKALLEFETLEGDQVRDIIETGKMRNPPKIEVAPPPLPPPPTDSTPEPPEQIKPELPPGGYAAPAPA